LRIARGQYGKILPRQQSIKLHRFIKTNACHIINNASYTFGACWKTDVMPWKYKEICYIVSVKVQFFWLPIGQNCFTCRSTKRHVRQPVRSQTFIDRSIIKWVQHSCVSTMKFQSSFLKLFTKHLRRSFYPVLVSN
jgi:hypothetical protein